MTLGTAKPSLRAPILSVCAKRWRVPVHHVGVATDQGPLGEIAAQNGNTARGNDALEWECKWWM